MKKRAAKMKKKKKSHIPFRLNLLLLIVFFSFIALIVRLGYIQLTKGDDFAALVRRTETITTKKTVPRGKIYDSEGRLLVGNEAKLAITYTREYNVKSKQMMEVAKELTKYVWIDTKDLKERDLKDYWYINNPDKVDSLLTPEEKQKATEESLTPGEVYSMRLEHITAEDINYSEEERQVIAVYTKMNSAYSLATVTIKNQDVTETEIAQVSEHLNDLPGIDVSSDWDRTYPMNDMLRSILGTVSTEKSGLPSNKVNALLAKGRSLNDRVGVSYLEEEYDEVLTGTKTLIENTTNSSREIVKSTEVYPGKPGSDLILTIDTDFQQKIEDIAKNELEKQTDKGMDRLYIVAMNPQSGDIIGIAGKKRVYDDNEKMTGIKDDALGAINSSYGMGSSIKAATVLAGYMDGVISLSDNEIVDEPIVFEASKPKTSVFNRDGRIKINDITALERSSNVYMIKLAMRMGGQYDYVPGGKLNLNLDVFDKLRRYYAEFGLGVRTGIDLPNESVGFNGGTAAAYSALDFSFGQFDLYTPLQLTQYMATVANNGVRVAPHLVKEIHSFGEDGTIGKLETVVNPKIMNSIPVSEPIMERVQKGLYEVTHGNYGTARTVFQTYSPVVSGKTGTTEAFYAGGVKSLQGEPVTNITFASYAPADNPEIVVTVVSPYFVKAPAFDYGAKIAEEVYKAYFGN
ncbi:penicillin-binding transpeptidase domain-containing protein [Granulicatella balaenopterae]|nr:penicillin-binding transpeptidase domain-containing protein [Granulicatella balaenopterae]